MSAAVRVTLVRDGEYLVEVDGHQHVVFVAGARADRWLHWKGHVFRRPFDEAPPVHAGSAPGTPQSLTAPMPAVVLKVTTEAGASVRAGDTLIVLEAMKMELPLRAEADAVVRAVRCRVGELVQAGAVLVELA